VCGGERYWHSDAASVCGSGWRVLADDQFFPFSDFFVFQLFENH
jgi:hypothetical protein